MAGFLSLILLFISPMLLVFHGIKVMLHDFCRRRTPSHRDATAKNWAKPHIPMPNPSPRE